MFSLKGHMEISVNQAHHEALAGVATAAAISKALFRLSYKLF